jgi:hypothetical protein
VNCYFSITYGHIHLDLLILCKELACFPQASAKDFSEVTAGTVGQRSDALRRGRTVQNAVPAGLTLDVG